VDDAPEGLADSPPWVRNANRALVFVVAPAVGLGGIGAMVVTGSARSEPILVLACLYLIGVPFARLADLFGRGR
jgi:hypothetical protein